MQTQFLTERRRVAPLRWPAAFAALVLALLYGGQGSPVHAQRIFPAERWAQATPTEAALNESKPKGAARPKGAAPAKPARPALRAPADLMKAIEKSAKARAVWDAFPPRSNRDYSELVLDA